MSRYKDFALKLIVIAIAEGVFFFFMPILASELGSHPYELISVVVAGIVVAYAVVSFFDSVEDSKSNIARDRELQRQREMIERLSDQVKTLKLDRQIEKEASRRIEERN